MQFNLSTHKFRGIQAKWHPTKSIIVVSDHGHVYDLSIIDLDINSSVQIKDAHSQTLVSGEDPIWDATGKYVLYRWGNKLCKVDPISGVVHHLFVGEEIRAFALSPDTNTIALLSNSAGDAAMRISVLNVDGGERKVVLERPEGSLRPWNLFFINSDVVMYSLGSSIFALNVRTGEESKILDGTNWIVSNPVIEKFVYPINSNQGSSEPRYNKLGLAGLDGQRMIITLPSSLTDYFEFGNFPKLGWSRSGEYIMAEIYKRRRFGYVSGRAGWICMISAFNKEIEFIQQGQLESNSPPDWDASNTRVSFCTPRDFNLSVLQLPD